MANSLIYLNNPMRTFDGREFIGVIGEIAGGSNIATHQQIGDHIFPVSNISVVIEAVTGDNLPPKVLDLRV